MTFPSVASEFVYVRTYARWIDELGRRENWGETVDRYVAFIRKHVGDKVPDVIFDRIREHIFGHEVMPSMRALWAAGPAAEVDSTTLYNCSFVVVDSIEAFSEILYILMCGTGTGFRVLQSDVDKLPFVPDMPLRPCDDFEGDEGWVVDDSRAGWADSVKQLLIDLYSGRDRHFAFHEIRPRGARLKTMGGRASGPDPLIRLHEFIREIFNNARGRKLTTLECHDICNMIAEIVVVGGVRRSSQISLSDLSDELMRDAKTGNYPFHRAMANNSAVYAERPTEEQFWNEWSALANSGTGERGIFNLVGVRATAPDRRVSALIKGVNPCGEVALRDMGMCNLSEVVVRADDTLETLRWKVRYATWVGAIQSTFTNFPYLRPEWARNCEEERLLGVSLTGQMDAPHLMTPEILAILKRTALATAKEAASYLGINMPSAITLVKPSGTVSQVVDCSSGLHPRYADYYIRRYRISGTDPLFRLMKVQGFQFQPENGQGPEYGYSEEEVQTWVCEFGIKSPDGAVIRHEVSAIDQLEHYKTLMENWCEHNASLTVYVNEDEWDVVGQWVLDNWDSVNGVSFLPKIEHTYRLAPYEDCTKEEYDRLVSITPIIDYDRLFEFELEDHTTGSKEVACQGGACELTI
jgi:ribonucleoside-triphosphate reductase